MGSKVSSHAAGSVDMKEPVGARGHTNDSEIQTLSTAPEETFIQTSCVVSDEDYDSEDSDSVDVSLEDGVSEPDDFFSERNAILADCQKLALMARFYSHPEISVITTDPCATSRCYFDRPSAPKVESVEDMECHAQVLADMAVLKKLVRDYMHPELPVTVSDPSSMARCYFDRPSAPEVESVEEVATRAQILSDTIALKSFARDYMHPELPVTVTDPSATARCYFDRFSAPDVEPLEDTEIRAQILADSVALKKSVVDYMHPEVPVSVSDPSATARCYFERPSAPDVEAVEDSEIHAQILADAVALKKAVMDYMHPELPVTVTDPTASTRCFFDRYSAPEVESVEDTEIRAQVLADAVALKSFARDYMHPELPVIVTDPSATARCYFDRPEVEAVKDSEIRAQILADAVALKKAVMSYLHPELPVTVTDPTASARCYFDRPSAPEVEAVEDSEIRAQILADAVALKSLARDYMHPELPVIVTDPTASARCYFDRPSAPEVESVEDTEIRAQVLADAVALRKAAMGYMHPEVPVSVSDPSAAARCFFDRYSAPEVECVEDSEIRAQVLADMAALKKSVTDYMHPELPVVVTDPFATARCYFDRPSADVSTFMSRVSVISTGEVVRARSDTEQFDLEDDVFHDMKDSFTRFSRAHSFGIEEESNAIDKEEEGHLSRSPSSVMLFDMVGERAC